MDREELILGPLIGYKDITQVLISVGMVFHVLYLLFPVILKTLLREALE